MKPQEENDEETTETTYYNIPKRKIYYMCLNCGYIVSKEELESMPSMMCPMCASRIFIKIRSTGIVKPRRVYAI
jgi:DNA-directed RNA polymerase subunit P